jgi:hypothetical protein
MMPSVVILHPLQLVADNYFTNSRHERLLATGVLLLKSNKEYVLTFKILAQALVSLFFTILAI